jgi:hypothetical protein
VIGLLPTPEEVDRFTKDSTPDKRERWIDHLLGRREEYAQHWLSFWNDALRNDYKGTGYIDGGRKQITSWLFDALATNMPYDQFVRELVSPTPASEGFVKGIVWRGVVNASQIPEVQAAQNVSQVFLGINMKCASCHDSFINDWTLKDAYGLAGIFAERPLEMHHCDKPTGEYAPLQFVYPELGSIDPKANRAERLDQLAALMTSPRNGRLARTIVNRLWARFLGHGLIEPVDEMDHEPWNAALLEWLAADLVDHDYDLKHTIRRILSSRAYQMPARASRPPEEQGAFVFRGPLVRRLSAEQFVDAASTLTGVWHSAPAVYLDAMPTPEDDRKGDHHVRFRSGVIREGYVPLDVDLTGASTLWLVVTNGVEGKNHDWANWIEPNLHGNDGVQRLTDLAWKSATTGHGKVEIDKNCVGGKLVSGGKEAAFGIGTHGYSIITYRLPEGTSRLEGFAGIDDAASKAAEKGHEVEFLVLTDVPVRSAVAVADPLTVALGRPNREQVVTHRPSAATTLEALELTNGEILSETVERGAAHWLARQPWQTTDLVRRLYLVGLGREPDAKELATAVELVGSPPSQEGTADLLWILLMLPEFQLIY